MIVIAAGGTGGHIFPALAIATELNKRGYPIGFIGRKGGLEERILKDYPWPFWGVNTAGVVGKSVLEKVQSSFKILKGIKEATSILKRLDVQLVVGMGSYVSVPVAIAGKLKGIDLVIHEQNVIPGKANQFLSRLAKAICISFEKTRQKFPRKKCFLTGNPVREEIIKAATYKGHNSQTPFTILILGGSQGAKAINELTISAWKRLGSTIDGWYFIHQTGQLDYDWVKAFYKKAGLKADVRPFISDMANAYSQADLVIARAGATTIAEIVTLGLPSILIPFPGAVSHQLYNAQELASQGAAIVMVQDKVTAELLANRVFKLWKQKEVLKEMGHKALALAQPQAAIKIAEVIERCLKN